MDVAATLLKLAKLHVNLRVAKGKLQQKGLDREQQNNVESIEQQFLEDENSHSDLNSSRSKTLDTRQEKQCKSVKNSKLKKLKILPSLFFSAVIDIDEAVNSRSALMFFSYFKTVGGPRTNDLEASKVLDQSCKICNFRKIC